MNIGDSPSGKATDSDSVIRVFESLIPSQTKSHPLRWLFVWKGQRQESPRLRVFARGARKASARETCSKKISTLDILNI